VGKSDKLLEKIQGLFADKPMPIIQVNPIITVHSPVTVVQQEPSVSPLRAPNSSQQAGLRGPKVRRVTSPPASSPTSSRSNPDHGRDGTSEQYPLPEGMPN